MSSKSIFVSRGIAAACFSAGLFACAATTSEESPVPAETTEETAEALKLPNKCEAFYQYNPTLAPIYAAASAALKSLTDWTMDQCNMIVDDYGDGASVVVPSAFKVVLDASREMSHCVCNSALYDRVSHQNDWMQSSPVTALNRDGRVELFVVGRDNSLWRNTQLTAGGPFGGWKSLGGYVTSTPAIGINSDGRLEVFVLGGESALWHKWQMSPGGEFISDWQPMNGNYKYPPALGYNSDGRMELFMVGKDDSALYHQWQVGQNSYFAQPVSQGGSLRSPVAVGYNLDGRMELFAIDDGARLVHAWQTGRNAAFVDLQSMPAPGHLKYAPSVGRNPDGRMELYVVAADGTPFRSAQTAVNSAFGAWGSLQGQLTSPIAVGYNSDGRLELFALGTDNTVVHRWQTERNGNFSDWSSFGGNFRFAPSVALSGAGRMELIVQDGWGNYGRMWQRAPSNAFDGWTSMGSPPEEIEIRSSNDRGVTNGQRYLELYGSFPGYVSYDAYVNCTGGDRTAMLTYVSTGQINIAFPDPGAGASCRVLFHREADRRESPMFGPVTLH